MGRCRPRPATRRTARPAWLGPTVGEGPADLLFLPGIISHVEHVWDDPGMAGFLERLCSFARVILMDRRGTGLSDPLDGALHARGRGRRRPRGHRRRRERSRRPARLPDGRPARDQVRRRPPGARARARALRRRRAVAVARRGYDWANDAGERSAAFDRMIERWGTGAMLERDRAEPRGRRAAAGVARAARAAVVEPGRAAPGGAKRDGLRRPRRARRPARADPDPPPHGRPPRSTCATRATSPSTSPARGYVELEGVDNLPSVGDSAALLGEIEEFLTGGRARRRRERELLTILFSDIVGSTGHAARLGDAGWRDLLAAHDARRPPRGRPLRRPRGQGDRRRRSSSSFDGPAVARGALRPGDRRRPSSRSGSTVRVGLHTGECELLGDDVGGMAVHIAARVAELAEPGELLVSGTVYGTVVGVGAALQGPRHAPPARRPRTLAALRRAAEAVLQRPQPSRAGSCSRGQWQEGRVPPAHGARAACRSTDQGGPPRCSPASAGGGTFRGNGPWIVIAAVRSRCSSRRSPSPPARTARCCGGARNPSSNASLAYSRETQIIANNTTYGTRQSNKSTSGGGAIYGCRAGAPARTAVPAGQQPVQRPRVLVRDELGHRGRPHRAARRRPRRSRRTRPASRPA